MSVQERKISLIFEFTKINRGEPSKYSFMTLKEQKLKEIGNQLDKIVEQLEVESMKSTKLHEVERGLLS